MIEEKQIEFCKKKHCYREVKRAQWNNYVRVNILTITRKHKRPKNDIVIYPTIYRLMTWAEKSGSHICHSLRGDCGKR